MKILWLSHLIPYPPKGGVLQRSYHLLYQIAKEFEVDLLAFHQPKLMDPMFNDSKAGLEIAKYELKKICRTIEIFEIPSASSSFSMRKLALKSLFSRDPYNINWLKSKIFSEKLVEILDDNEYDLVHFDTISFFPYLRLIPNTIAISLNHHNIESHMLLRRSKNERNLIKKIYFKQEGIRLEKYERIFCKFVDVNITCSDLDAERLAELVPGSNAINIPNGVDTGYFVPNQSSIDNDNNCKKILFIGRLNWYPNRKAVISLANEIWPALKKVVPNIHCDIIGANPPDEIIALSKTDPNFKVHGFVDDILPFMTTSSVYICPISDGGGTKLKILDALAMGMPIIAHPTACEGINVSEGINVLFASRPSEYVSQILPLFNDQTKRVELGNNARKLIEDQYSYTTIGNRLCKLYNSTVQSHAAKP